MLAKMLKGLGRPFMAFQLFVTALLKYHVEVTPPMGHERGGILIRTSMDFVDEVELHTTSSGE